MLAPGQLTRGAPERPAGDVRSVSVDDAWPARTRREPRFNERPAEEPESRNFGCWSAEDSQGWAEGSAHTVSALPL